jgi:hypothetical protein
MASAEHGTKLRILLIPFFATSHIVPYTDFAVRLAATSPDAVEPTMAVTPANVAVVRAALERHGPSRASSAVNIATYPFPDVEGLPASVENLTAAAGDAWRIDAVALDEALTRPAQEALIRERSPDVVFSDVHFFWNPLVAGTLGVPCVTFSVIGPFSSLAMRHVVDAVVEDDDVVRRPSVSSSSYTDPEDTIHCKLRASASPSTRRRTWSGPTVRCTSARRRRQARRHRTWVPSLLVSLLR